MKRTLFALSLAIGTATSAGAQSFQLTPSGYFRNHGVDVMAFDDIYPEGHQGGLCIIMHGNRDDRWIYTENNPARELTTAANLAATARVLLDYNPALSDDCLDIARKVYRDAQVNE